LRTFSQALGITKNHGWIFSGIAPMSNGLEANGLSPTNAGERRKRPLDIGAMPQKIHPWLANERKTHSFRMNAFFAIAYTSP
jgi:hypothetical protein